MPTSYDSQTLHELIESVNLLYDVVNNNYIENAEDISNAFRGLEATTNAIHIENAESITDAFRGLGGPAGGLVVDGRSFMERHYKEYITMYGNIDSPDPKSPALDAFLSTFKHHS